MLRRLLQGKSSPVFILLILLSALSTLAQTTSPPLIVRGLGNASASLDGQWQFRIGDDRTWSTPTYDDSAWERISVDKRWGEQNHYDYTGFAWYRRNIEFAEVPGAKSSLVLFLPPVQDACEIYWNGNLIGQVGKVPPNPVWSFEQVPHTFALGEQRTGVLAIRVWKAPYASFDRGDGGGLSGPPVAGTPESIAARKAASDYRWLRNRQYTFGLDLLYGIVGILSLLAWLRNRSQMILLWMSLFSIAPILVLFLVAFRLNLPYTVAVGVLQPVLSTEDISLWFLLLYLLELDTHPFLPRLTRILAYISIISASLDGLLSTVSWTATNFKLVQITDAILTAPFTLVEVFPLILIAFALRKRLDPARWLVAIFASLTEMIVVVRIAVQQGQRFTHLNIAAKIDTPLFTINGNPFRAITVASSLLLLSIAYAVYRYSVEKSKRQGSMEQELKSAQELQRVLIPETLPALDGYAVTSAYQPAQQVGGDFFQLIPQSDGSALLVLGDVSGKGLKAAMTVSLIVGALRTLAETTEDPAEILTGLNRRLHGRLQHGFVTCLVLKIDPHGQCVIANAGHPSPFVNDHELGLPPALPLGLLPSATYDRIAVRLAVGDRLTLFTDGLLEARSASGEIFSFERLQKLIASQPDARQATEAAVAFGQEDDITVLTLTRLATGIESSTSLVAPEFASSAI